MLYNEFDEFFKDRLKDYSSPVHAGIWRRVRTGWGRRRLFRTRWGLAGGAAVVVVAVVMGYFIVRPGKPMVGHAAAGAAAAAVTVETSVSRPATGTDSATGRVSGRSPRWTLSQGGTDGIGGVSGADGMGGAEGGGQAAGGTGGGGRTADGGHLSGGQVSGDRGSERQGYRGREGLDHERYAVMPSLAQLSSRAAIYAKPIKFSPVVSAKQKSRAGGSDLPGNLHLDIYGSPDIPTKQFALSYTAGVRMTMLITQHFFVSAGLQYSKANVKRNDSTAGLYPAYFNNIDLPVLIGYTVGNDRFRFFVDGGAIFNLFSHAVSPVGWGWPNRTGPSAYLGLDFARTISDRLSLFAEPYGRCLFTDYKSLFPSQTYTGGALIGIRYNFMRR